VPAICLYLEIAISKLFAYTTTNCLFATAVGLSALHLSLTWRLDGEIDPLIIVLYLILCLLWRKQDKINLEIFFPAFGTLLIALVLVKASPCFGLNLLF